MTKCYILICGCRTRPTSQLAPPDTQTNKPLGSWNLLKWEEFMVRSVSHRSRVGYTLTQVIPHVPDPKADFLSHVAISRKKIINQEKDLL